MANEPRGPRGFPDWETLYKSQAVETMPWFHPSLDPDLDRALKDRGLVAGSLLDVGSGPGTQAVALAQRGFSVTATDISGTAVAKARERAAAEGTRLEFVRDDILDTKLKGPFDLAFDRGCFHVLPPDRRPDYVRTLARLLRPAGILFLKCFSDLQPGDQGPHRLSPDMVREAFASTFEVVSIERTVYQGGLVPNPQALFCTLVRPAQGGK